jgi:hypothetical protein
MFRGVAKWRRCKFLTGVIVHERPPIQIGLNLDEAAGYLGLSNPDFMALVREGILPMPADIHGTQIWQIRRLSLWFNRIDERYSVAREEYRELYNDEI